MRETTERDKRWRVVARSGMASGRERDREREETIQREETVQRERWKENGGEEERRTRRLPAMTYRWRSCDNMGVLTFSDKYSGSGQTHVYSGQVYAQHQTRFVQLRFGPRFGLGQDSQRDSVRVNSGQQGVRVTPRVPGQI
ncbi:hypothetical protein Hanom_Chr12g01139841 [Helianthus anomalus]